MPHRRIIRRVLAEITEVSWLACVAAMLWFSVCAQAARPTIIGVSDRVTQLEHRVDMSLQDVGNKVAMIEQKIDAMSVQIEFLSKSVADINTMVVYAAGSVMMLMFILNNPGMIARAFGVKRKLHQREGDADD